MWVVECLWISCVSDEFGWLKGEPPGTFWHPSSSQQKKSRWIRRGFERNRSFWRLAFGFGFWVWDFWQRCSSCEKSAGPDFGFRFLEWILDFGIYMFWMLHKYEYCARRPGLADFKTRGMLGFIVVNNLRTYTNRQMFGWLLFSKLFITVSWNGKLLVSKRSKCSKLNVRACRVCKQCMAKQLFEKCFWNRPMRK